MQGANAAYETLMDLDTGAGLRGAGEERREQTHVFIARREERDLADLFEIFSQPKCREALSGPDFDTPESLRDSLARLWIQPLRTRLCRREIAVGYGGLFFAPASGRHTGLAFAVRP